MKCQHCACVAELGPQDEFCGQCGHAAAAHRKPAPPPAESRRPAAPPTRARGNPLPALVLLALVAGGAWAWIKYRPDRWLAMSLASTDKGHTPSGGSAPPSGPAPPGSAAPSGGSTPAPQPTEPKGVDPEPAKTDPPTPEPTKTDPLPPPVPAIEPRQPPGEIALDVLTVTFDGLKPGEQLDADSLSGVGLRMGAVVGQPPMVSVMNPAWVAPQGVQRVAVMQAEGSSIRFEPDRPIIDFKVTRVGVKEGALLPKWRLTGFDQAGQIVVTSGEEESATNNDPNPRTLEIKGEGIVQVEIEIVKSDDGLAAILAALPIARMEFSRVRQ